MCRLAVGFKNEQDKAFNKIMANQEKILRSQKDGMGALLSDGDNVHVKRSLNDYDGVLDSVEERVDDSRLVALHSRFRTAGSISLENVHFFEHNNWVFAHNGHVSGYTKRWTGRSHNTACGFKPNKDQPPESLSWEEFEREAWGEYENNEFDNPMEELNDLYATVESCTACGYSTDDVCQKHASIRNRVIKLESEGIIEEEHVDHIIEKHEEEIIREAFRPGAEGGQVSALTEEGTPRVYWNDKERDFEYEQEGQSACDSLMFLRNLEYPLTKENVTRAVDSKGFHGMGFLYNKETHQAYLIVKKTAYVVTDPGHFAMFFSFKPSKAYLMDEVLGVPYLQEPKELTEGVYAINL